MLKIKYIKKRLGRLLGGVLCVLGGLQVVYADGNTFIAEDKTVWVVDSINNFIQHRNLDGSVTSQFGSEGEGAGQLHSPSQIALAGDGSVWVADGDYYVDMYTSPRYVFNAYRLQHFKADGTFISQFGSKGIGAGQFTDISEIALAEDGSLWVMDDTNRIQHLKADGTLITQLRGEYAADIAIAADGSIWLMDVVLTPSQTSGNFRFRHYALDGTLIKQFVNERWSNFYADFTVATDGSLWAAGYNNLQHFSADGLFLGEFGLLGGQWSVIQSIANYAVFTLSVNGSVWVSDVNMQAFHPFAPTSAEVNLPFPAEYNDQQQKLYLQDVLVNGQHYQATFQNQNGQFKLLFASASTNIFEFSTCFGTDIFPACGSSPSTTNSLLYIPIVKALGQYYKATLKHLGNYVFELQSVTSPSN